MKTRSIWLALLLLPAACDPAAVGVDGEIALHPNGDVLVARRTVDVQEQVPGDVMAVGRSVFVDGEVGGSVLGAGEELRVDGRVDGSVRGAGRTIVVGASVGRNLTVVGAEVVLDEGAVVAGNTYAAGGEVRIEGVVQGDLYAGGESVIIAGVVDGDVRVESHTLRLEPDARIAGELRYRIDTEGSATIAPSAQVTGSVRVLEPREPDDPGIGFLLGRVVAFLVAGAAIVVLAPRTLASLLDPLEHRPGASAGYGLLTLIAVPVGIAAVAATVVGIPLALTVAVLLGLALYFAPVVPALWIGRELLGVTLDDRRTEVKAFLVGGTVVALAGVSPWIGFPTHLAATAFGIGAVVLTAGARSRGAPSTASDVQTSLDLP